MPEAKVVICCASGPSFDLNKLETRLVTPHRRIIKKIIGVNNTAFVGPMDIGVTMDRLWYENNLETIKNRPEVLFYVRSCVWNRYAKDIPNTVPQEMEHGISDPSNRSNLLRGRNSGLCAANLALLQEPTHLFLIGYDMGGNKPHWHPQYGWSSKTNGNHYKKWALDFNSYIPFARERNIKIFNVCPTSTITAFPKISYTEAADLLAGLM